MSVPRRRIRPVVSVILFLILLAGLGLSAAGQEKLAWTVVHQDFRNSAPLLDFLRMTGPDHDDVAKPGPEGLRVTLPGSRPVHHPVNVTTTFALSGDFEITGTYEFLSVARPKKGYGAGVAVTVSADPKRREFAKIGRLMRAKEGSCYLVEAWRSDPPKDYKARSVPTEARTGQLRIERTGDTIRYLVADVPTNEFREVLKHKFTAADLAFAHFEVVDSGEPDVDVDVRLVDWTLRLEKASPEVASAVKLAPKTSGVAGTPTPSTVDPPARTLPRLVWVLIVVAVLAVVALGTWLVLRTRRKSPAANPMPADSLASRPAAPKAAVVSSEEPIAFACAGCQKPLKARRTSAGKSVKCPQCGHATSVPGA